ncbi:serine-rich adhesin for platelets-like isoform X2 [Athalia rosae]|uniref:serine-rich adhesin for platelets-like isoform X2 n=1 Tax=Athalia rosae TaxID=37344 RepID=UPI002033D1C7|nr:serine-rich adhesin for platelets-like isoform X2 [Athalia rosae]
MEALLPSEIARLVFGYLEDQKCAEAARSFLEASPHLQECRTAVLSGRRFNTRVNGYTLIDIFDKFFAAHALVQERLGKVADCEQVRQCGDLLEQLRFLIGGSRGQRFVVNINVPSQANSQTYGGSPQITSSNRKRHHSSGSDRDRTKRTPKSLHQLFEKHPEPVSSQRCDTVEATPLESLPGHTNFNISSLHEPSANQNIEGVHCTSTKNDPCDGQSLGDLQSQHTCDNSEFSTGVSQKEMEQDNSSGKLEQSSPVSVFAKGKIGENCVIEEQKENPMRKAKTMATSTDELTTYSSIEVQTTPYALSESESNELEDEHIENLSLLTKELLNRTELQERIAENINKAILPIEMPSKDESINESLGGELNTSIMVELNNAIKSIVAATETDPIFEHFLDEIIGPNLDTDTSPDEDPDIRVTSEAVTNSRIQEKPSNTTVVDMDLEEETAVISGKCQVDSSAAIEVPLKQRLRSSSRQQNNKLEDDGDKPKDVEKTDSSLDDHNAAAILSIINANIVSDKQMLEKSTTIDCSDGGKLPTVVESTESVNPPITSSEKQVADSTEIVENDGVNCQNAGGSVPQMHQQDLISEQEMMAMPTLIVCSQEEIRECVDTLYPVATAGSCSEARFIPIAPKGSAVPSAVVPLYLKAVQVPQIEKTIAKPINNKVQHSEKIELPSPLEMSDTNRKRSCKINRQNKNLKAAIMPKNPGTDVECSTLTGLNKEQSSVTELESITLYANDNSFGTMIETGNMPTINLDDSMTLTGTGLSPYLKLHGTKNLGPELELPCEAPANQLPVEEVLEPSAKADESILLPHTENILITRRTPKSLLKSRAKNNRLSMSTPRRRNSHIRALDFNTPMKSSNSEQKAGDKNAVQFSPKSTQRMRSVCRTSLFKSPPFSNSTSTSLTGKTPVKDHTLSKVPIATRSPAPKLMGGWDKYTGVGMILGGTSPHPSSASSVFGDDELNPPIKPAVRIKKSWDADLRQALQDYQEPTSSTSVTKKGQGKGKGKPAKNGGKVNERKLRKSESSESESTIPKRGFGKVIEQNFTDTNRVNKKITDKILGEKKLAASVKEVQCPLVTHNVGTKKDPNLQVTDINIQSSILTTSESARKIRDGPISKIAPANQTKAKAVVKKYAKLKTLETSIRKGKTKEIIDGTVMHSTNSSQRKFEHLKISPETRNQLPHMSQMIDPETPRKSDNSISVPPTPRLLSPTSSTITPFTKITGGLSKIPSFVSTPEFPPTPSIALSPMVMQENTIDEIKKGNYGTCSPYYQPSNEQPDVLKKINSGLCAKKTAEVSAVMPLSKDDADTVNVPNPVPGDFTINASNSKLEITQFEVIKENLPKAEARKELKISAGAENVDKDPPRKINRNDVQRPNVEKKSEADRNSSFASENESSNSSSSDSSSSSSSSSSWCSCSSIATTSTPFKYATKCKTKSGLHKETSNDSDSKRVPITTNDYDPLKDISPIATHGAHILPTIEEVVEIPTTSSYPGGEESPVKLLPLIKTQEEVDTGTHETPAKDEALLSEANISETPSSSKCGMENLTNLHSKISALDGPKRDQDSLRQNNTLTNKTHVASTKTKVKILSVQHVLADVSATLKPTLVSDMTNTISQSSNNLPILSSVPLDAKLGMQLEEKRLRLLAKLKTKPQNKGSLQKVKHVKSTTKKTHKTELEPSKPFDDERKDEAGKPAPYNSSTKTAIQVTEEYKTDVKDTVKKTKPKGGNPTNAKSRAVESDNKPHLSKVASENEKQDKCGTTHGDVEKSSAIDKSKGSRLKKKSNTESSTKNESSKANDPVLIQKKQEHQCIAEASDLNNPSPESRLLIDKNELVTAQLADTMKSAEPSSKATSEITESTYSVDLSLRVVQEPDKLHPKESTDREPVAGNEFLESTLSRNKDERCGEANVANPMKKSQVVSTLKIDQIKRDLFSDEDNSDQRTTRSRTRQLSDAQKNDPGMVSVLTGQSGGEITEAPTSRKPKEELATVLECLQLVPANKTEVTEKASSSSISSINKLVFYDVIYDDTVQIRKKRKRFSKSSLEYEIRFELPDEDSTECPRLMTPTDYEEIYSLSPTPKKRKVTKKLRIKSVKPTKVDTSKSQGSVRKILKNELTKSLATLSSAKLKTSIPKTNKSTTKVQPKQTDEDDQTLPKSGTQVSKKRRMTNSEEQSVRCQISQNYKTRLTSCINRYFRNMLMFFDVHAICMTSQGKRKRRIADPQTLLNKLDLDLFLTTVHGPVEH